jgi:hypothetical protein
MQIDENTWQIDSNPQENGIWGTPFNLVYLDKFVCLTPENTKLQSAIVIAIAESTNDTFEIKFSDEAGFTIFFTSGKIKPMSVLYKNWKLQGNVVYFIPHNKESKKG